MVKAVLSIIAKLTPVTVEVLSCLLALFLINTVELGCKRNTIKRQIKYEQHMHIAYKT